MKSAIYYPYLTVQSHGLMKHALLFWDQLEVITPFDHIDLPDDKELAAATELLVKPCNPSVAHKREAHLQLMEIISKPLPNWFFANSEEPGEWILAEKFDRETWNELRERRFASYYGDNAEKYWSNKRCSMLMMSVLADCCAGKTKVTATDESDAFNTLGKCLAVESGAHPEWLRQEEKRSLVSSLTEQSEDLEDAADGKEISDRYAGVMAAELIHLATTRLEKETDPEKRWQCLREVHRELSQLRSDDHRAVRTFIKRQNWIRKTDREDEEAEKRSYKEDRERLCAPIWAQLKVGSLAEAFGGGEFGREVAAHILEIQNGLPMGTLSTKPAGDTSKPSPAKPNPTESKPIQPNPT